MSGDALSIDFSLTSEPFSTQRADYIRASLAVRVRRSLATVCLYGPGTFADDWVLWTLETAYREGRPIVGTPLTVAPLPRRARPVRLARRGDGASEARAVQAPCRLDRRTARAAVGRGRGGGADTSRHAPPAALTRRGSPGSSTPCRLQPTMRYAGAVERGRHGGPHAHPRRRGRRRPRRHPQRVADGSRALGGVADREPCPDLGRGGLLHRAGRARAGGRAGDGRVRRRRLLAAGQCAVPVLRPAAGQPGEPRRHDRRATRPCSRPCATGTSCASSARSSRRASRARPAALSRAAHRLGHPPRPRLGDASPRRSSTGTASCATAPGAPMRRAPSHPPPAPPRGRPGRPMTSSRSSAFSHSPRLFASSTRARPSGRIRPFGDQPLHARLVRRPPRRCRACAA